MWSSNLTKNLKKVIELHSEVLLVNRKQSVGKPSVTSLGDFDVDEYNEYMQAQKPLHEYFYSIPFNEIVEIETVMIVGRNGRKYYPKNFSETAIFNDEKNRTFNYADTEENKKFAVGYITSKSAVLSEYLTKGAEILNISLG